MFIDSRIGTTLMYAIGYDILGYNREISEGLLYVCVFMLIRVVDRMGGGLFGD